MAKVARTKVKTETIGFVRADGTDKFVRTVYCDKSGLFSIKLPEEVYTGLVVPEDVTGHTLEAVEREFDKLIKRFKETLKTCEKVILYSLHFNDGTSDSGGGRSIAFCSGIAIAVQADVFVEVLRTDLNGAKRYSYEHAPSSIPRSMRIGSGCHARPLGSNSGAQQATNRILWSEANEAFFASMATALLSIMSKLETMTKDPEKLQLFILSNQLLLPAPSTDATP